MRTGEIGVKLTACIITIVAIWSAQQARAGVYPTNTCVSGKMTAAAAYCQSALKAWSIWDKNQDNVKRAEALGKAVTKLGESWTKAETKATDKDVDCAQTTLSLTDLQALVDAAVADVKDEINTGLDLGDKDHATCGKKLLNAAAKKCAGLLKAEAKYIKKLGKNMAATTRDAEKTKARGLFTESWSKATTAKACPTTADRGEIESKIDDLNDQVVMDTTVSPNVDNTQFTTITITPPASIPYLGKSLEPVCKDGSSPYSFFVKRGSVNKLLMYYQGGGACWDEVTCGGTFLTSYQALCDTTVNTSGSDNPNNQVSGFADRTNPDNPFKDWNIVFVSYCSCDIHYGDAVQDYDNYNDGTPIHVVHHGFQNAKVAEKWAREHFVNPEMVFVTGSSAGSYGALFNAPLLHRVWPESQFRVLGDAGNGVITTYFLQHEFSNWNFKGNLPKDIPGVIESIDGGTGMVAYIEAVAAYFPNTNWAHYSTAYDGSMGGQTGFYNVMAQPSIAHWPNWWESSCDWNEIMVQQAGDTYTAVHATPADNYRYYIGNGSRHTMWGSNKVYTDTSGGVQLIVDWINAMLTGGPGWGNVQASPFNVLLPGDPSPGHCSNPPYNSCQFDADCDPGNTCSAQLAPFEVVGGDHVEVNCP